MTRSVAGTAPRPDALIAVEPEALVDKSGRRWTSTGALALLALALLSLGIYIAYFTASFWLGSYFDEPLLDLGKLTGYTHQAALVYGAVIFALFALYFGGYLLIRRRAGEIPLWLVLVPAAGFALALFLTYPITAVDVFDYIGEIRVLTAHGANPLITPLSDFPGDRFLPYVAWPFVPSRYGPIWLLLSVATTLVSGDDLLRNLVAFKALQIGFLALDLLVLYAILKPRGHSAAALGLFFLAWNPLVQLDVAGNAHNDLIMMFFVLLAVYALLRDRSSFVLPALALGALVKFIPALFMPLAFVFLAVRAGRNAKAWGVLLASSLAAGVLIVAFYYPFWEGPDSLGFLRFSDSFTASLPNLLRLATEPSLGASSANVAKGAGYALFGVAYLLTFRLARRGPSDLLRAFYWTTLALILFATIWFQSWYVLWLLPFAAVLPDAGLRWGAMVLSLGALSSYEIFVFVWVINWNSLSVWQVQGLATAVILGPMLPLAIGYGLRRLLRYRVSSLKPAASDV